MSFKPTFLSLLAKGGAAGMEEDVWVPALDESHLQEEAITLVFPKGLSIILVKKDGRIYALRNRCAHMSCTLAGGRLDGFVLQCPCHGWKYDIATGEFLDAREITVPTYTCKSQRGKIFVKLENR
jgi:nitrite reductase/ring-hydroxylating ferredoxin subunit